MGILKIASCPDNFRRSYLPFASARLALQAFLRAAFPDGRGTVLLPAYIGFSTREGSGLFDPVSALGLEYAFYGLDASLHVDVEDFSRLTAAHPGAVVVLVHYFGYVDPRYEELAAIARRHGALILEDEAHAMLTDVVGGLCGRLGDACIYSTHKLLPEPRGGLLVVNEGLCRPDCRALAGTDPGVALPWRYDLHAIAARRVENARFLAEQLEPFGNRIAALRPRLRPGEAPQTFPVVVEGISRDALYFGMNERGFGVVSLYHSLVTPLDPARFPVAHAVADSILNLPVHQDCGPKDLREMLAVLGRLAEELSCAP